MFWLDAERLDEALRLLDDIEDEGEMYRRVVIDVTTSDGPVERTPTSTCCRSRDARMSVPVGRE